MKPAYHDPALARQSDGPTVVCLRPPAEPPNWSERTPWEPNHDRHDRGQQASAIRWRWPHCLAGNPPANPSPGLRADLFAGPVLAPAHVRVDSTLEMVVAVRNGGTRAAEAGWIVRVMRPPIRSSIGLTFRSITSPPPGSLRREGRPVPEAHGAALDAAQRAQRLCRSLVFTRSRLRREG